MNRLGGSRAVCLSIVLVATVLGPGRVPVLVLSGMLPPAQAVSAAASVGWPLQAEIGLGQAVSRGAVAISASGSTALVGLPNENSGKGAVLVFTRAGTTWTEQQPALQAGATTPSRLFGTSVAVSADGTTAVVGASAAAYILKWDGATWHQQVEYTSGSPSDRVGQAVAISGDGSYVLLGAGGANSSTGSAIALTGAPTWEKTQPLASNTPASEARLGAFGASVALNYDGSVALIGAPGVNQGDNQYDGMAYIFRRVGATWSQVAAHTGRSDSPSAREFGWSASLSGDGSTALVGSLYTVGGGGAAFVYSVRQSAPAWSWKLLATLKAPQSVAHDNFGQDLALSADGTTALVGSPYTDAKRGAAYIFRAPAWAPPVALPASDVTQGAYFGSGAGLSEDGSTALVAPGYGEHVYVFGGGGGAPAATSTPSPVLAQAALIPAPQIRITYSYLRGHRAVLGHGWLTVRVTGAPGLKAAFSVSLRTGPAAARTTVFTGTASAVIDATGTGSARIAITYDPPGPELALLTVTVDTAEGSDSQLLGVLIVPA